jgi:hypothetical protein
MSFQSILSVIQILALAATTLFGLGIILQLLLAAGILPIRMVWGGRQQTLTVPLRIASCWHQQCFWDFLAT